GGAAELGIDLVVGDDVVAVEAARRGAADRRAVDVADAETHEVRQDARCRVEIEAAVQLQTIGRAGDAWRDGDAVRRRRRCRGRCDRGGLYGRCGWWARYDLSDLCGLCDPCDLCDFDDLDDVCD